MASVRHMLLTGIAVIALAAGAGGLWLQSEDGRHWVKQQIETAAGSRGTRLAIDAIGGRLPFAPTATGLVVADDDGPWLWIERVALRLDATALLRGVVRFVSIELGPTTIDRPPASSTSATDRPPRLDWPRLPVTLIVERFALSELALDPALLGDQAGDGDDPPALLDSPLRLGIDGSMRLDAFARRAALRLDVAELAPESAGRGTGRLQAGLDYVASSDRLGLQIDLDETDGGMLADLAGLPMLTVAVIGDGTLDNWRARVTADAGQERHLAADLSIVEAGLEAGPEPGRGRRLVLDASTGLGGLFDHRLGPLLDGETRIEASLLLLPDRTLRVDRFDITGGFGAATMNGLLDPQRDGTLLDLTLTPASAEYYADLSGDADWRELRLAATVSGALAAPRLSVSLTGDAMTLGTLAVETLRAELALTTTGSPGAPIVDAEGAFQVALFDAELAGVPVAEARIDGRLERLRTRPGAELRAGGRIAGLPAGARAELRLADDARLGMDAVELYWGNLRAEGTLQITRVGALDGAVSFAAGHLEAFEAILGLPLSGRLRGTARWSAGAEHQRLDLDLAAADAGIPGTATLGSGELTLSLALPHPAGAARLAGRSPDGRIDAQLTGDALRLGDLTVARAVADLEGSLDDADLGIVLSDPLLALDTRARIARDAQRLQLAVGSFDLAYGESPHPLRLLLDEAPARLHITEDGIDIDGLGLTVAAGRFTARGLVGRPGKTAHDLTLTLSDLPLQAIAPFVPVLGPARLDLSGLLDARLRLLGELELPRADGELTLRELTVEPLRMAGLAPWQVRAALSWQGDELAVQGRIDGADAGELTAAVRLAMPVRPGTGLPMLAPGAPLTGRIDAQTRLAALNPVLAARGDRIDGRVAVDLDLAGTLERPRVDGTLALADGSLSSAALGITLNPIVLQARAGADRLTLSRLRAETPNGGLIRAAGDIGLDAAAGFPAELRVQLQQALAIDSEVFTAELDGDLAVEGPLTQAPRLDGRIEVREAEIRLPSGLPPSIPTLEVEEINVPPELAARRQRMGEGQRADSARGRDGTSGFDMTLDLELDAPGSIRVRGYGLDGEVGGRIEVHGSAAEPRIGGGFQLRRGHLDTLGRRFRFDEGVVTLSKESLADARIRFVAVAPASDLTARIVVDGLASAPRVRIESEPELPQDEVLARVLFGRRASSLTALQSLQLARAAADLASLGSGGDTVDLPGPLSTGVQGMLRGMLNAFRFRPRQGNAVSADRTDTDRPSDQRLLNPWSVGLDAGLNVGSGQRSLDLEVLPNLSLDTDVGINGTGRIGVEMDWEF